MKWEIVKAYNKTKSFAHFAYQSDLYDIKGRETVYDFIALVELLLLRNA